MSQHLISTEISAAAFSTLLQTVDDLRWAMSRRFNRNGSFVDRFQRFNK